MIISVDTDLLIQANLSADDFLCLKLILTSNYDVLTATPILPDIDNLKDQGYLEGHATINTLTITEKGMALLGVKSFDLDRVTDVLRKLWIDTKPGATTSPNGVYARLQVFRRHFPDYEADDVLLAAATYVDKCRVEHFKYIKALGNFILTEDNFGGYESELANYCESIEHNDGASEYKRA